MLFIHLRCSMVLQVVMQSGCFPVGGVRCTAWNTRGLIGSVFSSQRNRERKHKKLLECNNILCLQEVHGKDEFLQALQVLAPRFQLFGTIIPSNENAGGTAICIHKDLLPDDATVTHFVTCPGRGHTVSMQSDWTKLVIVSVHFEPELTVRRLRERLCLITPKLALTHQCCGFHNGRLQRFITFFRMFSRSRNLISLGRTPQPMGSFVPCQELVGFLSTCHLLRHGTFTIIPTSLRTLGTGQFRAIIRLYIWLFKNLLIKGDKTNTCQDGMPKHPFVCSILKRLHDGHEIPTNHFVLLLNSKLFVQKPKSILFVSLNAKHPTALVPN